MKFYSEYCNKICQNLRIRKQKLCVPYRAYGRRYGLFWDVTKRSLIVTDVSGQLIGPIFRVQAVQEMFPAFFLNCLTLEDGTDRFSRNAGNYQSTLRNILEEPRSLLHRERILKSLTDAFL